MQPTYLPWIGYFDLIDQSDVFVLYDDVQFQKQSWHCRNKIKTPNGEQYLSVTVNKTPLGTPINEITLNNITKWHRKHLNAMKINYSKSTYFSEVFAFIEGHLQSDFSLLTEVTTDFIKAISTKIGIETTICKSSELPIDIGFAKEERLIEMCKYLNCNNYVSPPGSAIYINEDKTGGTFPENGINLFYHNYNHPIYPQMNGSFIPYIGIIDLLFNVGFQGALKIIKGGRKELNNFDTVINV
jgi:hypothetical protein